ncbi:MAG: hypothetical protein NVS2B14_20200 [Chamaesiphon sp.]
MNLPKVIFLDAVGTLFGVRESVGHIYSEIAQRFGVEAPALVLNQAFFQTFKASEPLAFPGVPVEEIRNCEFKWWQAIAVGTFQQAGVLHQFSDFGSFFEELYTHFATDKPWFVYSDVREALEHWYQMGIALGVVSNFDSRLYSVLQAFDLQ